MENLRQCWHLFLILLLGMLGGGIVVLLKNGFNDSTGSIADWVSGIGTLGALIFAYKEIIDSRKQFDEEHKAKLKVYANWKEPLNLKVEETETNKILHTDLNGEISLHIIPVNKGLASGIYRYFGICKAEKVGEIISLVKKAERGKLSYEEEFNLLNLICYDPVDVGQTDKNHDMNVTGLLYPDAKKVFQTLKPNNVGEILNKNKKKIEEKLEVNIFKNKLAVLYIDPQMKIYSFEVEPFQG